MIGEELVTAISKFRNIVFNIPFAGNMMLKLISNMIFISYVYLNVMQSLRRRLTASALSVWLHGGAEM